MKSMLNTKGFITTIAFLIAAALLVQISGCGGGGGGRTLTVSGAVSDVEGNLVPDARVTISSGGSAAKTSFNGAYKLTAAQSGWQTVTATAVIDGRTWRGTQAVQVFASGPTLNVNVVIGQFDKLGSLAGRVRDVSGFGIDGARVFVSTTYGSFVDLTDADGDYRINNVPASVKVGGVDQTISYTMTASKLGFSNQTRAKDDGDNDITVDAGSTTTIDFVITATEGSVVPTPADWTIGVTAWTFPQTVTRSPGAYNAIRAKVSSKLARALLSKTVTRAPAPGSLIEIDVTWFESWNAFLQGSPPDNLAGFSIYRRIGSQPTGVSDRIYFDRQPLLTDFFDTSSDLTSGQQYFYRIKAVNTNYLDDNGNFVPESESVFSDTASATPLDQLQEITPFDDATESTLTPVVFSWMPLGGAGSYKVFVYDQFPEMIDSGINEPFPDQVVQPIAEIDAGSATSASDPGLALIPGRTYYWVVIAADTLDFNSASAFSIGELRKFTAQ
ncbi:MAG: carboxypeptidase-like regulatory domain-containing protein [Armatimonadota bacterium]|nr:carboxypeptidase-like regulatory domain-containing protein [Armatimonadota bacterium]